MNILDFFAMGSTIKAVFRLGFLPKREEFYELTPDQYEQYYKSNEQTGEKIFVLLPDDPQQYNDVASGNVLVIFTEREMHRFEGAGKTIESYCTESGKTFATFEEKLYYVAGQMPPSFSQGTKYAE
ncbi:MAG: hypothetical protein LBO71_00945, partial [Prevotellaceae bacterium]|nr:hypothetical protein [Prevotellaceae bacterium]